MPHPSNSQSHHDLPTSAQTVVLYHANCNDGFGAAWTFWHTFGVRGVKYQPVSYGKPIPDIARQASRVYILDFSYSRAELEQLNREVGSLVVLDHHKSAAAELDGLPFAYFDQKKSGAVLAWEYFQPDEPVPELLHYVQDRDLWQWRLEDSRELNEALLTLTDRDFDVWAYLVEHWDEEKKALIDTGRIALDIKRRQIDWITRRPAWLEIDGYIVPAVNCPTWQSEIGEALCQQHPDAPFAAVWSTRSDGDSTFSLRSRPRLLPATGNRFGMSEGAMQQHVHDCSQTAARYGGGGHAQAAGFRLTTGDIGFVYHDPPQAAQHATEVHGRN